MNKYLVGVFSLDRTGAMVGQDGTQPGGMARVGRRVCLSPGGAMPSYQQR